MKFLDIFSCSNNLSIANMSVYIHTITTKLGTFSIEKKCEISHFWSGPPLPLKSVKLENFFFTHQLKHVLVKSLFKKIYFFTQNPRRLKEISRFSPNLVQNCDFHVRGYSPPHILKKFFFADLHALGHERKKNKKSVKMTQFCPDHPPPHTFFQVRRSLTHCRQIQIHKSVTTFRVKLT